jgi:predicted RNA methylase
MPVWSSTDFAYQCLRDERRTTAYRDAIQRTVRPGDVAFDASAGTGILALVAAEAGASRVYAVELDPTLAAALRQTVDRNGYEPVVEVIEGDALTVDPPEPVDVVVSDLIDTGLLDELQVPVANSLHRRGIVGPPTRSSPRAYHAAIEIAYCDYSYYGFSIFAPRHDWPHLAVGQTGSTPSEFHPLSRPYTLKHVDFGRPIEPCIATTLHMDSRESGPVNALRLSGRAQLTHDLWLGATNAINGDKVLPLEPLVLQRGAAVGLSIGATIGAGLETLVAQWTHLADERLSA